MGKNIRIHHHHHLCCHRSGRLMMSLFLLFLSSLIQVRNSAEGRAITRNVHTNAKHMHGTEEQRVTGEEEKAVGMIMQSVIGSRPPSCDGRSCRSCAHCQAVQVPVAPQVLGNPPGPGKLAYTRGDGISNYKPMTWKCKCGDSFFNP